MNRNELIVQVSKETGFKQTEVREIVHCFIKAIGSNLFKGLDISLEGLGKFILKKSKERTNGFNFETGQKDLLIPKRYRVTFSVSPTLKNKIASKKVY